MGAFFERANSIIPLLDRQAISALSFRFDALIKQSHQIDLGAVDEHPSALNAQVGNEDRRQRGIEDRQKITRTLRDE